MKTRLIKEFQILRLPFIATLLLTIIPLAIWGHTYKEYSFAFFGFGCIAMAALSFGTEFQHRTIPLLLAQPISRSIIWREKMFTLATFLGLSFALPLGCLFWLFPMKEFVASNFELLLILAFIPFCAFCTTPYICLLLRNTTLAIVLAVMIPLCIGALSWELGFRLFKSGWSDTIFTTSILLIYCLLFFVLGFYKWKTLEDWDSNSQEVTVPKFENLLPFKRILTIWTGPFASLFKKEMHLQKICFSLTAGWILLAIFGICLFPFRSQAAEPLIGLALVMPLFLIPLIAGTIPFTEERNWGIAEWHLTLPPSALKQWMAKFLASSLTILSLGSAVLLALYLAVVMLLVPHGAANISESVRRMDHHAILLYLLILTVPTFMASFSTNTARSLILSVLGMAALFMPMFALRDTQIIQIFVLDYLHVDSFTIPVIEAILFICLVLGFTYFNFSRPRRPTRILLYQCLTIYALFTALFLTCMRFDVLINQPNPDNTFDDRSAQLIQRHRPPASPNRSPLR